MPFKLVHAKFVGSSQSRWLRTPVGDDPKLGDLVVTSVNWNDVPPDRSSPRRDMVHGVKVGQILDVSNDEAPPSARYYLHLIAMDDVKCNDRLNKTVLAKAQQKAEAKAELNAIALNADADQVYAALAEKDARAAELLKVLKDE